jgi:AmmeMemoRadiSam system protein A
MARAGIVLGVLSPHAPIIVPEIGDKDLDQVVKTRTALQGAAALVRDMRPDTVVVIAPHGPVVRSAVTLLASPVLQGNFREFGIAGTSLRFGNDLRLVNRIREEAARRKVTVFTPDADKMSFRPPDRLHYAVLVPLHYFGEAGLECRLVAGAVGPLGREDLYRFGQGVQAAALELGVRVVYVASGDLSHRLTEGAPAGYDPMGRVFDRKVVDALARADVKALLDLDHELVERAGECGFGPILTLFGALDGLEVVPEVLSYEGPFGVGYAVATFLPRNTSGGSGPRRREVPGGGEEPASAGRTTPAEERTEGPGRDGEDQGLQPDGGGQAAGSGRAPHPFVRLARLSLETYVREGRRISAPGSSPGLDRRAGAFVSLKKGGQLRGCIGTVQPAAPNLAEEIVRNAIQAGTADPRFPPVREDELGDLEYSVDVLESPEPVSGVNELDPAVYGVIVTKGDRTGLLLPDLDGVDTVEDQVRIAMQKAGITPGEPGVRLFRFRVTRYR